MNNPPRTRLSEEARSALIAEILGDVGRVHDDIVKLGEDLKVMSRATQDQSQNLLQWSQVLDKKIMELDKINLSSVASERLTQHAREYLRALSSEVSKLVENEIKGKALPQNLSSSATLGLREFLGCMCAVVLGNFVWTGLVYLVS